MSDITLPGDFTVSANHGAGLKLSVYSEDVKLQKITVIYEMFDAGAQAWLGPKVIMRIDASGSVLTLLDGGQKTFTNIKYDTAAVQNKLDRASISAFIEAQGGDLRTTP